MTVTYQLTAEEFSTDLVRKIKSQFGRYGNPVKVKIEIEELDETEQIMANPYLYGKILEGIEAVNKGNTINFTSEQFNEFVKKHSIHTESL